MDRFLIDDRSEILVRRGFPARLLPDAESRRQVAILTQPGAATVAKRVAGGLDLASTVIELPDRDAAKDLAVVGEVYRRLAELNLGRHDTVVAVGGGALTDVAGFVAATWLRGVEAVLVPTTLLGAVDAAIGGKTGINLAGKNLVGAFWLPSRVVVDLDVLDALPTPLRLEGTAEIVKMGYVADPSILAAYERHGIECPLDEVVAPAIGAKVEVVREDLRESGRRAILNFGHTVGHAVELVSGLAHGLAVSVGMVAAATLSNLRYGFDHRALTDLLFALGLPVAAAGTSGPAAMELIARDKKRIGQEVRMVLLRAVGEPVVEGVGEEELELALSSVGAEGVGPEVGGRSG